MPSSFLRQLKDRAFKSPVVTEVLGKDLAHEGLSYNSVGGMVTGSQKLEILDQSGAVIASASSKVDVSDCPQGGFCNFNYYVAGL